MVGVDNEVRAIKIVAPCLEGMDHSQEFLFVCGIVTFGRVQFPGGEGDRAAYTMLISLGEYSANGKARGVCFDSGACSHPTCRSRDCRPKMGLLDVNMLQW